jgi:hypothetical protein
VTPKQAFDEMIKGQVGPFLREAGFTGSAGNWTRTVDLGDMELINFQRSRDAVTTFVNLAVMPKAWWELMKFTLDNPSAKPNFSYGVWNERMARSPHPLYAKTIACAWSIQDEAAARTAGDDMCAQFSAHALPAMARLVDRPNLLAYLRTGEGGGPGRRPRPLALAVLLSEYGPSAELDEVLARTIAFAGSDRETCELRERQVAWIQERSRSIATPAGM